MKIITVFGTRPEAIKMCPLVLELKKTKDICCCVCLTGQHKEMLDQAMNVFHIEADYNLNIMKENQSLSTITSDVLMGLEQLYKKEKPDLVLVHGDTSSSFAATLSAFYNHIPIGHVEAGLRTYDMKSPYPEEFNRQAIDMISDIYFAPTEVAKEQLIREGKSVDRIYVTGNTVIDALKITVSNNYCNEHIQWADGSRLILLTAHRRENLGEPMRNMFLAVKSIVEEFQDVKVIYPVHKNPKVRKIAQEVLGNHERIRLIEPLDVYDFHNFMSRCYMILTDSGGVQEEAPSLGKPVLVMRGNTERPEGVEAGTIKLVGTDLSAIYEEAKKLLNDENEYLKMSTAVNPYGDGCASEKIVESILNYFERN